MRSDFGFSEVASASTKAFAFHHAQAGSGAQVGNHFCNFCHFESPIFGETRCNPCLGMGSSEKVFRTGFEKKGNNALFGLPDYSAAALGSGYGFVALGFASKTAVEMPRQYGGWFWRSRRYRG